jgi:hypothetical protein
MRRVRADALVRIEYIFGARRGGAVVEGPVRTGEEPWCEMLGCTAMPDWAVR